METLNPRTDDYEIEGEKLEDDMEDAEKRHHQEHEEDFLDERDKEDREAFANEFEDEGKPLDEE